MFKPGAHGQYSSTVGVVREGGGSFGETTLTEGSTIYTRMVGKFNTAIDSKKSTLRFGREFLWLKVHKKHSR